LALEASGVLEDEGLGFCEDCGQLCAAGRPRASCPWPGELSPPAAGTPVVTVSGNRYLSDKLTPLALTS